MNKREQLIKDLSSTVKEKRKKQGYFSRLLCLVGAHKAGVHSSFLRDGPDLYVIEVCDSCGDIKFHLAHRDKKGGSE